MRKTLYILLAATAVMLTAACDDNDSFGTSAVNRLTFSADTISMDTVFSTVPTSTRSFWVHNKSADGIRCTSIRLANGNQTGFRVNVDGEYLSQTVGFQVQNVEIRRNDSIRVFVELTSPTNGIDGPQLLEDNLVFTLESGVQQSVNLKAYTWDATLLRNLVIKGDTTLDSEQRPIVIYGGLTVDSLATLRIAAGTTLHFHSGAGLHVYGRLLSEGTAENNVILRGDRTDRMFDYLPYDMVSGQWNGVRFYGSSYDNQITYTDIHSTFDGIVCDSSDVARTKLTIYNSTVHNCQGYGLMTKNSTVDVRNCQITNTLGDCVAIYGGYVALVHCTIAQFYPFDSNRGVALRFTNRYEDTMLPLGQMDCVNSIVTGYADDVIMGTNGDEEGTTPYTFRFINSMLRTDSIEDNERIVNVIWESDTMAVSGDANFRLADINMQRYDFHLDSLSAAIGAADPIYTLPTDRDGMARDDAPDMGCYEFKNQ